MLSLVDLEPEVLRLIAEYVEDSSPWSTKSLACVNRYLNQVTKFTAHRHVTLSVDKDNPAVRGLHQIAIDEGIMAINIQVLTVNGLNCLTAWDDTFWEPLVVLFQSIGKLRRFKWCLDGPLPMHVLNALQRYHKTASLEIYNFIRSAPTDQEPNDLELRLAQSPNLTHIRLGPHHMPFLQQDFREVAFRYIVGSAPNLMYVGLISETPHQWQSTGSTAPDQADLQKTFRKAPQDDETPNASIRQLTLDGFDVSQKLLKDWSPFIDLPSLTCVKFSRGIPSQDYFTCATDMLPGLQHVSLNLLEVHRVRNFDEKRQLIGAISEYIRTCSPLRNLSLWSWTGVIQLSDILQRHGETLESLHLHERERENRSILSVDDIISIRNQCPVLREFTFDLQRHDPRLRLEMDSNKQYYDELAKFPLLTNLQIYFDVGTEYLLYASRLLEESRQLADESEDISDDEEVELNYDYDEHSEAEDDNNSDSILTGSAANDAQQQSASEETTISNTTPEDNTPDSRSSSIVSNPNRAECLKRARREHIRPSRPSYLKPYAEHIWKTVFHNRPYDPHRLDIKVGEWESSRYAWFGTTFHMTEFRYHIVVRAHERDDVFEPSVSCKLRDRLPGRLHPVDRN